MRNLITNFSKTDKGFLASQAEDIMRGVGAVNSELGSLFRSVQVGSLPEHAARQAPQRKLLTGFYILRRTEATAGPNATGWATSNRNKVV